MVVGVSLDGVPAQRKFYDEQELSFDLLSDNDGVISRRWGLMMEEYPVSRRVTVYLDPEGVVRFIDEKVNVRSHGKDVVRRLEKLQLEDEMEDDDEP